MVFTARANSAAGLIKCNPLQSSAKKKPNAHAYAWYFFLLRGCIKQPFRVSRARSSQEYIFQPSAIPSRLKKYTPACFGVPLVGLGAPSCFVRLHSVPAGFWGVQSHSSRSIHHQSNFYTPAAGHPSARVDARGNS